MFFKYLLFRYKLSKYEQKNMLFDFKKMNIIQKKKMINQVNIIPWKKCLKALDNIPKKVKNILPIEHKKINDYSEEEKKEIIKIGENNINKYAVLLLAGGQGSRLGYDGPKGTYKLNIGDNDTFFSLYIKKIISFEKKYNVKIPIYIMTSIDNYDKTKEYFDDNKYFGKKESITLFSQEMTPVFDIDKKNILINNNSILMASSGHGNVFKSMLKNNIFKNLKKQKIQWLLITGIDNILMKPVDLFSLGLLIKNKKSSLGKSTYKLMPEEKMGVFCRNNGKIDVIEYSEIDENILKAKDKNGFLIYNDAHLLWNIYNVKKIKKIANKNVPYHVALKNIDKKVSNKKVYKLESFIFDYFRYLNDMIILNVNRNEEFAPIKNKEGVDSPETAYKLYTAYYDKKYKDNI